MLCINCSNYMNVIKEIYVHDSIITELKCLFENCALQMVLEYDPWMRRSEFCFKNVAHIDIGLEAPWGRGGHSAVIDFEVTVANYKKTLSEISYNKDSWLHDLKTDLLRCVFTKNTGDTIVVICETVEFAEKTMEGSV